MELISKQLIVRLPVKKSKTSLGTERKNTFIYRIPEASLSMQVLFDGLIVKEERISVRKGSDASKVAVTGEGLQKAIVDEPTTFHVDTKVFKKFSH